MNKGIAEITYNELYAEMKRCRKLDFLTDVADGTRSGDLFRFWFSFNRFSVRCVPMQSGGCQIWLMPQNMTCLGMTPDEYGSVGEYICVINESYTDDGIEALTDLVVEFWLDFAGRLNNYTRLFQHVVCNWHDRKARADLMNRDPNTTLALLNKAHEIWLAMDKDQRKSQKILKLIAVDAINCLDNDKETETVISRLSRIHP